MNNGYADTVMKAGSVSCSYSYLFYAAVIRETISMNGKIYEYDEKIHCIPERGGAYVSFPWNIREEFGRGRIKVHAEFDGVPYDGSIVNMGVKYKDGSVCYIIGITKAIRTKINKGDGDCVHVVIQERV